MIRRAVGGRISSEEPMIGDGVVQRPLQTRRITSRDDELDEECGVRRRE